MFVKRLLGPVREESVEVAGAIAYEAAGCFAAGLPSLMRRSL